MRFRVVCVVFLLCIVSCGPARSRKRDDAKARSLNPEFTKQVLDSKTPVLVDFWAEWCPPCRVVGPILEELASESEGTWQLVKVNVEESPEVSQHYEIESLPTLMVFRNGKEHRRLEGIPRQNMKAELASWIKKSIE